MANEQFRRDLAKMCKAAGDKVDLVVRKVAIELQTSMVTLSPVDTGRFKGAWACGVGYINPVDTLRYDKTKLGDFDPSAAVYAADAALKEWKPGQTIWLTNSLPYAHVLEYGRANGAPGSIQAPGGMVRLTVANYARHIADVVRNLP